MISEQNGLLEPIDGVFGLARNNPFYLGKGDDKDKTTRGPSYMMALENANLISQNTFSFALAPYGKKSYIDFGAPREDRMRYASWVQYIDLLDDFFWSAKCQGFAIGEISNSW